MAWYEHAIQAKQCIYLVGHTFEHSNTTSVYFLRLDKTINTSLNSIIKQGFYIYNLEPI